MRKTLLLAVSFLALLLVSPAYSYSTYDYKTGNQLNTTRGVNGSTQVRGYNTRTGSTWNTSIQKNGNMRGTDSKGNMWNYNENTGVYNNYGTGKSCYGKGQFRQCY